MTVRINRDQLIKELSGPNGPVWRELNNRGTAVLNEAVRTCPADEGTLRDSLTMEMVMLSGLPVARVGSNLEYAIWVHEGTGIYASRNPGLIRPKKGKYLKWPVKNNTGRGRRRYKGGATAQYAYAKSVKGMKGRPWLRNALRAAQY